jgi:hypothetical protein
VGWRTADWFHADGDLSRLGERCGLLGCQSL